jgi:hypothetical protein
LLPGGTGGKIRIIASDGYNTTAADSSGTFEVSNRAPDVHITAPKDGARFEEGALIHLEGSAQDLESSNVPEDNYVWSVNGTLAAIGPQAQVILEEGSHKITLTASDVDGNSDTDNRTIIVGDANTGRIYLPMISSP